MRYFIFTFFTLVSTTLFAQRAELGVHVTPNYGNKFEFEQANSYVTPLNVKAVNAGINYAFISRANWGLRSGLDFWLLYPDFLFA